MRSDVNSLAHTKWNCKYHIVFAPKYRRQVIYGKSYPNFIGYLKGKSSLMIFDRHANIKYRYGNRKFWCKRFYVDTVGRNKKVIEEYIRNQLQEDIVAEQITMEEYIDPFTGEETKDKRKKK